MLKVLELRFNQPCLHRGISRIYILMQICKAGLPAIFFSFVITHTALYRILTVFLSLWSTDHFWATRHQEVVDETTANFPRKAKA